MAQRMLLGAIIVFVAAGCSVAAPSAGSSQAIAGIAAATALATPAATPRPSAPKTPPPTLAPEDLPSDLDPELADAIRLRRSYGLRSDLEYVRRVANDPKASNDAYGVPVYPEEFEDAQWRFGESSYLAVVIKRYAAAHVDEFGGVYIDEGTRVGVVSLWTDHIAEHAGAIRKAIGRDARVAFAQVRYAEAELRALQDEVSANWEAESRWLADIPAAFQSVGVDIKRSQLVIEVSSAHPNAVAIIEAHFALGDRLRVESDGTGRVLIPWGTVTGRVTGIEDHDAWNLSLRWESDDSGECGGGDMGFGVDPRGRFELPCQAGTWTIIVVDHSGEESRDLGRGTVRVVADETVTLDIDLDP